MLNVKMLKPLFYMFINIHTSLNLMVLPLTLMPLRRLKNWDIKSVFPSLMLLRRQKDWDVKSVSPSPHRWPTVPLSICHGHVRTDECLPNHHLCAISTGCPDSLPLPTTSPCGTTDFESGVAISHPLLLRLQEKVAH